MNILSIRNLRLSRVVFCLLTLLVLARTHELRAQSPGGNAGAPNISIVITGARLIDGNGGPPIENSLIAFSGGRIVAVGPAETTPHRARTADSSRRKPSTRTGMTIIPGLISAHSHLGLVRGRREPLQRITRAKTSPSNSTNTRATESRR